MKQIQTNLIALIVMFLLVACGPATVETNSPDPGQSSAGPIDLPAQSSPAVDCPVSADNLPLLVVDQDGFCAVYPADYTVQHPAPGITVLLQDGMQDAEHARAHIQVEDAAGRSAEEVAMAVVEEFRQSGIEIEVTPDLEMGGERAWRLDGVPGQDVNRQLFAVHEGRLYSFLFAPADSANVDPFAQMDYLYRSIFNSFTFISPSQPTGVPLDVPVVMIWEGNVDWLDSDKDRCRLVVISEADQVHFGSCAARADARVAADYLPLHWHEIVGRFAPFYFDSGSERLEFRGQGTVEGEVWWRAIAAYARGTYAEADSGRVTSATRTAMSWWLGELPDQPGLCRHLLVLDYGYAYANVEPCGGGASAGGAAGWLETSEMAFFDAYLYEYGETYAGENYLSGRGGAEMNEADVESLAEWAEQIYVRLSGPTASVMSIAFVQNGDLWFSDGEEIIQLSQHDEVADVRLSDDGMMVAFTMEGELWTVGSDGSGLQVAVSHELLEELGPEGEPVELHRFAWIPGTRSLLFNTRVIQEIGLTLHDDLHRIDGQWGAYERLVPAGAGGEFYPSPDGRRIALSRPTSVSLVDIDGGNLQSELVSFDEMQTYSEFRFRPQIEWAANGEHFAFVVPATDAYAETAGESTVWRLSANGAGAEEIGKVKSSPFQPTFRFSSDLSKLAYLAYDGSDGGIHSLVLYDLIGGGELMRIPHVTTLYDWSATDSHFALLRGIEKTQVEIADLNGNIWPLDAEADVTLEFTWISPDQYLFLRQDESKWRLVLGEINGMNRFIGDAVTDLFPFDGTRN